MRSKGTPRRSDEHQILKLLRGQQPQDGTVITTELINCATVMPAGNQHLLIPATQICSLCRPWSSWQHLHGIKLQHVADAEEQQQHQQQGLQDSCSEYSRPSCLEVRVQWMPDAQGQLHPYSVVPDLFDSSDDDSSEPRVPCWNNLMLQLQQHYLHQQQQQQQQQQTCAAEQTIQQAGTHQQQQQQQCWKHGSESKVQCIEPRQVEDTQLQQDTHHTQEVASGQQVQEESVAAAAAATAAVWSAADHRCCQNCGTGHSLSWAQTAVGRTSRLLCNSCKHHYKTMGKHRNVDQGEVVLVPPTAAVAAALAAAAAAAEHDAAFARMAPTGAKVCGNCCSCITSFGWRRQRAPRTLHQHQHQHALLCNSCALYERVVGKQRPVLPADKLTAQDIAWKLAAAHQGLQQQQQQLRQELAEQHRRLQLQRERINRSRAKKRRQQQQQQQCSGLMNLAAAAAAASTQRQQLQCSGLMDLAAAAAAAAAANTNGKQQEDSAQTLEQQQQQQQQSVKRSKSTAAAAAQAVDKPPKTAASLSGSMQRQQQPGAGVATSMNSSNSSSSSGRQPPQLSNSAQHATKPRDGSGAKPPPFKLLKRNKILFRQRAAAEKHDISVCSCQPSKGQCCREVDDCLNCALKVCCSPNSCPAGEACQNTSLAKRKLPALTVAPMGSKGWGVVAQEDIRSGTLVAEYLGEVVPVSEGVKRLAAYAARGLQHTYLMDLSKAEVIDATMMGGMARYINHSCEPNCETQKWQDGGELVIAIVAIKDIPAGTELTYDYRYQSHAVPHARTRCCCGAASCSGWLGSLDPEAHLQTQLEQHHREAAERVLKQVDAVTGEEYHVDVLDTMDSEEGVE